MRPVILIVDDDPGVLAVLQFGLQQHFIVNPAMGLKEAERFLETIVPDAVVLDLNLKDSSGTDTFYMLKQKLPPKTPIIVVTGDEESAAKLKNEAHGIVTKGNIEFAKLTTTLKSVLVTEELQNKFYKPLYKALEDSMRVNRGLLNLVNKKEVELQNKLTDSNVINPPK